MNKNDIQKIMVDLHSENESLKEQNKQLKDEVNCLKGEQGKPAIKANSQPSDHSSEKERKQNDDSNAGDGEKKRNANASLN